MSEWRHAQWTGETKDGKRWCVLCRQAWPCDAETQRLRADTLTARLAAVEGALGELRAWVASQRAKPWAESGSFASRMTGEQGYDAALEEVEARL